jgi:pyruvate kinase
MSSTSGVRPVNTYVIRRISATMRHMRDLGGGRAKLVATIGPASVDHIPELLAAGMDVARINLSHGTDADHALAIARVLEADATAAVLVDLPGPKIRLGDLEAPTVELTTGDGFVLRPSNDSPGDASGAHVGYPGLGDDLRPGDRILLADGAAELRVVSADGDVRTEVVRGGPIRPRAGVSVPSERLSRPTLTEEDRRGAPRAAALGAHYLAQSFVRRADDIRELRALTGSAALPIVAKIETRAAVDDFDDVARAADAVMIARGDLGVELPFEDVPIIQKQLVRRALDLGVPAIVATQMLESMVMAPRPTRAEASDVANAIFDGADAILLSAETAIGEHPVLAVETASRIAAACDRSGASYVAPGRSPTAATDADALAYAAVALAGTDPDVRAVACYTRSGRTARILSALRPRVPILAFSPDPVVVAELALVHGVHARPCDAPAADARLAFLSAQLSEESGLSAGSAVVLVASTAAPGSGPNLLEVARVSRTNS